MIYGLCGSFEEMEAIAATTAAYWEIDATAVAALSDAEFADLMARIRACGIRAYSAKRLFPDDCRLTGPDVDPAKTEAFLKRVMRRLGALGVSVVVFGSGAAKRVPEGFSMQEAWRQLVDLCRLLSRTAAPFGITVVIEPLRRTEVNIITSVAEAAALVREADCPNVRLLADFYHMAQNGEDPDVLAANGDILRHTHIADPERRGMPSPANGAFVEKCFHALKKAGYNGTMTFEGRHPADYAGADEMLAYLATFEM